MLYVTLASISFLLCQLIVSKRQYLRRYIESRNDAIAVQSAHSGFVPRIGGLAIFLTFLSMYPFARYFAICNLVNFFLASCRYSACYLAPEVQSECNRSTGSFTFSSARHAVSGNSFFGPSSEKTLEPSNSDCTCTNDSIAPNYRVDIC